MDKLKHFIINDIIKDAHCKIALVGITIYKKKWMKKSIKIN